MPNRNAEKIRRRRENRKENQTPAAPPRSNNLWFWIFAAALILILGLLSYFAYTSDFTNELVIPIAVSVTVLLLLIIWYLPKFYVRSLPVETGKDFDRERERLKLEDDTRKTFAQIIGGIVFLGGLIFTYNTFRLQQEGQITDRFTKAVAQLGDDKLEVRLGGMYALERIAKDSPKDHWTVMEILSAYIRENAKKKVEVVEQHNTNKSANDKVNETEENAKVTTDIQAVLTIIGRRKVEQDSKTDRINLSEANLRGAYLVDINLTIADLNNADLSGANLTGADLFLAYLDRANLTGADLFLANLTAARLTNADLSGADLTFANLDGANLDGANLSGANLHAVKHLMFEILKSAIIDENTKLPGYLENRKSELLEISKKNLEEKL